MSSVTLKAPKSEYFYSCDYGQVKVYIKDLQVIRDESNRFKYIVQFTEELHERVRAPRSKWHHYLWPFLPTKIQVTCTKESLYIENYRARRYIDSKGNLHQEYLILDLIGTQTFSKELLGHFPRSLLRICCAEYEAQLNREACLQALREAGHVT